MIIIKSNNNNNNSSTVNNNNSDDNNNNNSANTKPHRTVGQQRQRIPKTPTGSRRTAHK